MFYLCIMKFVLPVVFSIEVLTVHLASEVVLLLDRATQSFQHARFRKGERISKVIKKSKILLKK